MELNFGVIRDRQGIYTGLLDSQSTHRQLAVCYTSDDKLIVKISMVKNIIRKQEGMMIVLGSGEDPPNDTIISFDSIQSIYPISDFVK